MIKRYCRGGLLTTGFVVSLLASAETPNPMTDGGLVYDEGDTAACIKRAVESASDETTVGQLRRRCNQRLQQSTDIEKRYLKELSIRDNRFAITAHRPNYILLAAHDTSGINTTGLDPDTGKNTETRFQVSMKFPVIENLLGKQGWDIYAGYTNRSFWQLYDQENSAPFRETNHEPEIWLSMNTDWRYRGFRNRALRLGFSHQSNGRSGDLSRSWNRLFGEFIFEKGRYSGSLKTWWRFPEDAATDDNPDITDYMGHFEFLNVFTHKKHSLSVLLRNNLRSDMRGAVQVDWNFPLIEHFDGYVQWFNGYGESLIDYNHRSNSFGIGVSLTDWL
ncbi:MAG: phospholipase A [Gammaproteobacteria bacterium]|nr:phospholipase A [Gammaproteobacteria bacterium]